MSTSTSQPTDDFAATGSVKEDDVVPSFNAFVQGLDESAIVSVSAPEEGEALSILIELSDKVEEQLMQWEFESDVDEELGKRTVLIQFIDTETLQVDRLYRVFGATVANQTLMTSVDGTTDVLLTLAYDAFTVTEYSEEGPSDETYGGSEYLPEDNLWPSFITYLRGQLRENTVVTLTSDDMLRAKQELVDSMRSTVLAYDKKYLSDSGNFASREEIIDAAKSFLLFLEKLSIFVQTHDAVEGLSVEECYQRTISALEANPEWTPSDEKEVEVEETSITLTTSDLLG